jgi:hypothetical protein
MKVTPQDPADPVDPIPNHHPKYTPKTALAREQEQV